MVLDGVNLLIHEGGHFVFMIFGGFIYFLGGTLMQILLPFSFVVYFAIYKKFYSATITLYWVGHNFLNVAVYVKDARRMILPLVGGNIHDWNYMLSEIGLLQYEQVIGNIFCTLGIIIIVFAGVTSYLSARNDYN